MCGNFDPPKLSVDHTLEPVLRDAITKGLAKLSSDELTETIEQIDTTLVPLHVIIRELTELYLSLRDGEIPEQYDDAKVIEILEALTPEYAAALKHFHESPSIANGVKALRKISELVDDAIEAHNNRVRVLGTANENP